MTMKLILLAIAVAVPVGFIIWAMDPERNSDETQTQSSFSLSKGQNQLPKLDDKSTC